MLTRGKHKLERKRELSREKLVRLAGVSNNTIINIEAGINQNPTIETLHKIVRAFNI